MKEFLLKAVLVLLPVSLISCSTYKGHREVASNSIAGEVGNPLNVKFLEQLNKACIRSTISILSMPYNTRPNDTCHNIDSKNRGAFNDYAIYDVSSNEIGKLPTEDYDLDRAATRLEEFLRMRKVKGVDQINVQKIRDSIKEIDCSKIVPSNSQACSSMIVALSDKALEGAETICLGELKKDNVFMKSAIEDQALMVKKCVHQTFLSNLDPFGLKK